VGVHHLHTDSSIHTAELKAVVHLLLTIFPFVSRLTVTLVVCQEVFTRTMGTGSRRALVYFHLTQLPLPSRGTAAVKVIKLVLTHSLVQTGLGIANWCTVASNTRLTPAEFGEPALLRGVLDIYERQVDAAHSHLS